MTKTSLLVASFLLVSAAAAQELKQAAPEARPAPTTPAPATARPLNLKLDDAARYTREEPSAKGTGEALPALGENAATLERPNMRPERGAVFPPDTAPGSR